MSQNLIINVAPTGMVPTKSDNPYLPVTPDEIAEDCRRCYEIGASIFHLHARDESGQPTFRSDIYREIIRKVRVLCPAAIICVSTSGRVFRSLSERSEVLNIDGKEKPDMASLTLGSLNFPREASLNEPKMIQTLAEMMRERGIIPELEIFDLGMIDYAKFLIKRQILKEPYYFNLLLGSLGTLSATPFHLVALTTSLPAGAIWAGAGIGRFQFYVNGMAITMGGNVRVGLEDNLYEDNEKRRLATNPGLLKRLVRLADAAGRKISEPMKTRELLGLV